MKRVIPYPIYLNGKLLINSKKAKIKKVITKFMLFLTNNQSQMKIPAT